MTLFDPIVKKNLSGTTLLVVHHRISHFSVLKSVSFLQFNVSNIKKKEVFISSIPIKSKANPSRCDSIGKRLTLWGTAIQSPQHIFGEG